VIEVVGVTLGWSCLPERVFRFSDGKTGLIYGDRRIHPECYGEDGWPIDPLTKQRLEIYEEPMARRYESFAELPRWVQMVLIFSAAVVLGAVAGLLRNEIVNLLDTL
jgi:hypothetical protein